MRIHLVDDDENIRRGLAHFLRSIDHDIIETGDGVAAWALLQTERPDLLITDVKMPGMDGLTLLDKISTQEDWDFPVMVMTAFATVEDAVEAMSRGAADYLTKPVNLKALRLKIKRIVDGRALVRENKRLRIKLAQWENEKMIGTGPAMTSLRRFIERIATDDEASVVIHGESGTGKELAARAIHDKSPRFKGPFIPVNCAALPENLLESELFGYKKGAFSGANADKPGYFNAADGGTLFLDEIGEMPALMQTKLLRVLQEKQVQRLGDTRPQKVDVRVVAASNRGLRDMMRDGEFREDLFYRLAVIELQIPALRDRIEDLPLLIDSFMESIGCDLRISKDVMLHLMNYDWPGNVRELENLIRMLKVTVISDEVVINDLPSHFLNEQEKIVVQDRMWPFEEPYHRALSQITEQFERSYLSYHLNANNGNVTQASNAIGLSRVGFHRKMKILGLVSGKCT
ncbi:sigma-54-dependent Fis family transcriptional regulator [bacterium]|nr:sigma-54-dependent Fis family transcriptional regulator [bacterium]